MNNLLTFINFLFEKLSEPGTQKGIALVSALIGYQLDPALLPQIAVAYGSIHAIVEIVKKG